MIDTVGSLCSECGRGYSGYNGIRRVFVMISAERSCLQRMRANSPYLSPHCPDLQARNLQARDLKNRMINCCLHPKKHDFPLKFCIRSVWLNGTAKKFETSAAVKISAAHTISLETNFTFPLFIAFLLNFSEKCTLILSEMSRRSNDE